MPRTIMMMMTSTMLVLQAFAVVRFLWHYAIQVVVFAFCYSRIFYTIRRQSKLVSGHAGRSQNIAMTTTSRDQNAGQLQQQATGTALSRTELNVLKTMITVIVVFVICWCAPVFANLLQSLGVSTSYPIHYPSIQRN